MGVFGNMKVLLLSAYHTDSHRRWSEDLVAQFGDWSWTVLTLPGRHFPWRIRGNPISWMTTESATLSKQYDLIVATSMVDLSTLIGLYPNLGSARKVLYFHENQFEYPLSEHQKRRAEPLMVSLYAALASDQILFNSAYNRRTFLEGARTFLRRMPERVDRQLLDRVADKSAVCPVPLPDSDTHAGQMVRRSDPGRDPNLILWNHRWEYDKNPDDFFAALDQLNTQGIQFRVAVVGQTFRKQPVIFEQAREHLGDQVLYWGFQTRADYDELLQRAGIVVSTAWHEFQGLSVLEATANGALPLVPDRLCYPEFYPPECRYDGTVAGLVDTLAKWLRQPRSRPEVPPTAHLGWSAWHSIYEEALQGEHREE